MKAWSSLVFTILALSFWDSVNSKLYDQEQPCGPDVKKHCAPGLKNEFSAVQCLQREIETDSSVCLIILQINFQHFNIEFILCFSFFEDRKY